ncbi:lactose-binding lectin l-2, partial [Exaiptasia diaphana]|uniref:C-type lectin domain-containing protein n=1 Tax=Exaiptasia diaphana TaxID=2652724 RepID=A0A913WTQ0_EXADI
IYVSSEPKTESNANIDCIGRGLSLAKITEQGVNEMLQKMFQSDFWIGLKKGGSGWAWRADSSLLQADDYSNWVPGELTNNGGGNCVIMDWTSGKWKRKKCNNNLYPFVCSN